MPTKTIQLSSRRFRDLEQDAPPEILYHYTDQAGLLGILATGELWATKVQYMNDATEFGFSLGLAREILSQRLDNDLHDKNREIFRWILDHLDTITLVNMC